MSEKVQVEEIQKNREEEAEMAQNNGVMLPPGRLLWVPPEGEFREVTHTAVPIPEIARKQKNINELVERGNSCSNCGRTISVTTILREHIPCGHINTNGFIADKGGFACSSCDTVSESDEEFEIVGTAQSCVYCGTLSDYPLSTQQ